MGGVSGRSKKSAAAAQRNDRSDRDGTSQTRRLRGSAEMLLKCKVLSGESGPEPRALPGRLTQKQRRGEMAFFLVPANFPSGVLVTGGTPKAGRGSGTEALASPPWKPGIALASGRKSPHGGSLSRRRHVSTCFLVHEFAVAHFSGREGAGRSQQGASASDMGEGGGRAGAAIGAGLSPPAPAPGGLHGFT